MLSGLFSFLLLLVLAPVLILIVGIMGSILCFVCKVAFNVAGLGLKLVALPVIAVLGVLACCLFVIL